MCLAYIKHGSNLNGQESDCSQAFCMVVWLVGSRINISCSLSSSQNTVGDSINLKPSLLLSPNVSLFPSLPLLFITPLTILHNILIFYHHFLYLPISFMPLCFYIIYFCGLWGLIKVAT